MASEITRENSIPKKSTRYYLGEAAIRAQFNDVEFYFEDAGQQEMYTGIMKKLFGDSFKFEKVFVTNGKYNANILIDKHRNSKRKVFILDKDFDDLLRKRKRGVGNVFYLSRYSIENFLLEKDALSWLIIAENSTLNRNTLALPYDSLIMETMDELRLLACYFFVAKKVKLSNHIPGFKSCSQSIIRFLDDSNRHICATKADAYWQNVARGITQHLPNLSISELIPSAKRSLEYDILGLDGVFKNIPGKHVIELLRNKITGLYPFMASVKTNRMVFVLADKCNFDSLATLKNGITEYLEAA